MVLIVHERVVDTTEQGFLCNLDDWDESVGKVIAAMHNIEMSESHWEIVYFIRGYYAKFKHLPNARVFTKAIRNKLGEEKGNSLYLHGLFPEGPLKYACKIAGLPKPPTCM
jgi:tRNA 2-thiouridine synthesizing protein E